LTYHIDGIHLLKNHEKGKKLEEKDEKKKKKKIFLSKKGTFSNERIWTYLVKEHREDK